MTAKELEALLTRTAFDAALALFSAYEVPLEPLDGKANQTRCELDVIGIVGFSGRQFVGTLVLGATNEPLRRSMPRDGSVRDWIRELANQLLGRIKNRVCSRGIEICARLPAVVSGDHLAPVTWRPDFEPLRFAALGGRVCFWIELDAQREITMKHSIGQEEFPSEGEVILF
jgi:hypothetical protein